MGWSSILEPRFLAFSHLLRPKRYERWRSFSGKSPEENHESACVWSYVLLVFVLISACFSAYHLHLRACILCHQEKENTSFLFENQFCIILALIWRRRRTTVSSWSRIPERAMWRRRAICTPSILNGVDLAKKRLWPSGSPLSIELFIWFTVRRRVYLVAVLVVVVVVALEWAAPTERASLGFSLESRRTQGIAPRLSIFGSRVNREKSGEPEAGKKTKPVSGKTAEGLIKFKAHTYGQTSEIDRLLMPTKVYESR